MTPKRKVKGLLGVLQAEADGVEWELEPTLGLGLGATEDARRWAEIGRNIETLASLHLEELPEPKRGRGQPKKSPRLTNHAQRAFILYMAARRIREALGADPAAPLEIPLPKLIEVAVEVFPTGQLFSKPVAMNKIYESVKLGRAVLDIDDQWRSSRLEAELSGSLFNPD